MPPVQPVVMFFSSMRLMYLQKLLERGTSRNGAVVQAAGSPSTALMMKAETLCANKDLAAAQTRARAAKKGVMVIFGANWCPDCIVLHRLLDEPETRAYVRAHFEVVAVDLGRFDKNVDLAQRLGLDRKTLYRKLEEYAAESATVAKQKP